MALYMLDMCDARVCMQCLRIVFDMPEGPGTLKGLSLLIVVMMRSGVKVGNCKLVAHGGLCSRNWWSS